MRCVFCSLSLLMLSCATADGIAEPDAYPGRDSGAPESDAQPIDAPFDAGMSACESRLQGLGFDFEGGAEGFVHGDMPEVASSSATWTFDHWEVGNASAATTCASGQSCWGTNLSGNYIQCQRAYLVSPPIDLSSCGTAGQDVTLQFQHNYDFWTGSFEGTTWFDGGRVEITSNGTSWQSATLLYPGTIDINPEQDSYACVEKNGFYVDGKSGYVGSSGGWVNESITIPAALASVTFQIRFVYGAGVSSQTTDQIASMAGTAPGWFIDDLRFQ